MGQQKHTWNPLACCPCLTWCVLLRTLGLPPHALSLSHPLAFADVGGRRLFPGPCERGGPNCVAASLAACDAQGQQRDIRVGRYGHTEEEQLVHRMSSALTQAREYRHFPIHRLPHTLPACHFTLGLVGAELHTHTPTRVSQARSHNCVQDLSSVPSSRLTPEFLDEIQQLRDSVVDW